MNPPENATPLSEPVSVTLGDLERGTIGFSPERTDAKIKLWCVAISKFSEATYQVNIDGTPKWGPARFPPTDIDNQGVVWLPPARVNDSITVKITQLTENDLTRRYRILPLGWEEQ